MRNEKKVEEAVSVDTRKAEKCGGSDQTDKNAGARSKNAQDSVAAKRNRLKEQIRDLKMIISEIESNLDILKFEDITVLPIGETVPAFHAKQPTTTTTAATHRDLNAQLQNELYKYAGFSCVSFAEEQYTFHLSTSGKSDKEHTYAVQVLSKHGNGSLGKWVMPMSIDMDELTSKNPVKSLNDVPFFLKTCKHHVDCYFIRQQQFQTLMETVSTVKCCTLQTNLGYTRITLELVGVHDAQHDSYMDLVIYLLYDVAAARPHKIEVDTKGTKEMDKWTASSLKSFLKCFKTLELNLAFEAVMRSEQKRFTWKKEQDDDSPLELNSLSNEEQDEEGFLEDATLEREVRRKRRLRTRWKGRKRQKSLSKILEIEKPSMQLEQSTPKESDSYDTGKTPKHKEKIPVQAEETPLNKAKGNLRQTKLRFNLEKEDSSSSCDKVSLAKVPLRTKLPKPLTSTPLHHNPTRLTASTSFDVSDISVQNKR